MSDYISREAAYQTLTEYYHHTTEGMHSALLEAISRVPAADVRPVVTCSDCKWWTKQEASLQGRCELLQMYPTGTWFCANGKREGSEWTTL